MRIFCCHSSSQLSIVDSARRSIEGSSGRRIVEKGSAADGGAGDSVAGLSTGATTNLGTI